MNFRFVVEVTMPDGTRHNVTGKQITHDQVVASVAAGGIDEIWRVTDCPTQSITIFTTPEREGGAE